MYAFQADENAVPVFYVNKETWDENYKWIICNCLQQRRCYLLVEPSLEVTNRYVEFTLETVADFNKNRKAIEKVMGIKK